MAKLTKAQTITQAIADDIVHGRLAPGTALDETVDRGGLRRVAHADPRGDPATRGDRPDRGAAEARRGRRDLSEQRLDDMFAVMAELEALCARWCAIAMTASERRGLLAVHEDSGGSSRPATAKPMSKSIPSSTRRSIAARTTASSPSWRCPCASAGALPARAVRDAGPPGQIACRAWTGDAGDPAGRCRRRRRGDAGPSRRGPRQGRRCRISQTLRDCRLTCRFCLNNRRLLASCMQALQRGGRHAFSTTHASLPPICNFKSFRPDAGCGDPRRRSGTAFAFP